MSAILNIRKNVLGLTQKELADVAGTGQATVSRWETGELSPDLTQLGRIREYAIAEGKGWRDEWLFAAPGPTPPASPAKSGTPRHPTPAPKEDAA